MQQTNIHPVALATAESHRKQVQWAQRIAAKPGLYSDRQICRAHQILVDLKHRLGDNAFLIEHELHRLKNAASVRIDALTRHEELDHE